MIWRVKTSCPYTCVSDLFMPGFHQNRLCLFPYLCWALLLVPDCFFGLVPCLVYADSDSVPDFAAGLLWQAELVTDFSRTDSDSALDFAAGFLWRADPVTGFSRIDSDSVPGFAAAGFLWQADPVTGFSRADSDSVPDFAAGFLWQTDLVTVPGFGFVNSAAPVRWQCRKTRRAKVRLGKYIFQGSVS